VHSFSAPWGPSLAHCSAAALPEQAPPWGFGANAGFVQAIEESNAYVSLDMGSWESFEDAGEVFPQSDAPWGYSRCIGGAAE
jgi:hypothetical protein